jgi:hypothetical protein
MTATNWKNNLEAPVNVEGRRLFTPRRNPNTKNILPEKSGVFCQLGATVRSRTA